MKTIISTSYDDMSRAAADFLADYILHNPGALLCLPSGETPTGTFQYLVKYAQAGKVDMHQCRFVGLDEWVGMDERDEGSCRSYMDTQLFHPLHIKPDNIIFFDGKAPDLDQECRRIDAYILAQGPIDIMLVGIGMNGHIGLNEPGTSFDTYSHHTSLDPLTKKVAQKYFQRETKLGQGITLGLKHLQEAGTAILMASGLKKAEIMAKALEGAVTPQVPASIMQTHNNGYVFLDQEAASQLSSRP